MEIGGAMSAGLSGMQRSQALLDRTAQKISESGLSGYDPQQAQSTQGSRQQPQAQDSPNTDAVAAAQKTDWNDQSETDLSREMTNLMVANKSQAANAETVKTSDAMLRELLYMRPM